MTLRTLNYGNYGIFLIMGNAGNFVHQQYDKTAPLMISTRLIRKVLSTGRVIAELIRACLLLSDRSR